MNAKLCVPTLALALVALFVASKTAKAQSYNVTLVETPNGRVFYTAPAGAPFLPADLSWYGLLDGLGPFGKPPGPLDFVSSYNYGVIPLSVRALDALSGAPAGLSPMPTAPVEAATAIFEIRLPADAQLWVQGKRMMQTGSLRRFTSPELDPSAEYVYHVRARWTQGGQAITREQPLLMRAGERESVTFVAARAKASPDKRRP